MKAIPMDNLRLRLDLLRLDLLRFRFRAWLQGWETTGTTKPLGPLRDSRTWVCTNCMDRSPSYQCSKCGSAF